MDKIVTISRQYASGGRTIGKLVAQELGIPVYDSKIIKDTMKRTGLSEQVVEDAEQRSVNAFLFNLAMGVDDALNHMKTHRRSRTRHHRRLRAGRSVRNRGTGRELPAGGIGNP